MYLIRVLISKHTHPPHQNGMLRTYLVILTHLQHLPLKYSDAKSTMIMSTISKKPIIISHLPITININGLVGMELELLVRLLIVPAIAIFFEETSIMIQHPSFKAMQEYSAFEM